MPTVIKDIIKMDRERVVKCILYVKTKELNLRLSENDLNVFSLFIDVEDKDQVITDSLERGFVKSWQSGENTVSKLVRMRLLEKPDKKKRRICPGIFPLHTDRLIVANLFIHNSGAHEGS